MKLLDRYSTESKRLRDDPSAPFSNKPGLIFLLRHGQIQGHETRRFIGQTDVPLDGTGRAQALFWKEAFSRVTFSRIFASSLSRCQETVHHLCPEKKIITDPRLNEIDLGAWDGRSFDDIKSSMPELFRQRGEDIYGFRPPGGESFQDLHDRAWPFFKACDQVLENPVLVVTHSGVIRVVLCRLLNLPRKKLFQIKPEYSELFLLSPV